MAFFLSLLPQIWPWLVIAAAQITALGGRRELGLGMIAILGAYALSIGALSLSATLIIALGMAGAAVLPRLGGRLAVLGHLAFVVWSVALGAHLVPGVQNLLILDQVTAGPDSGMFTLYLNLDKPMVFFAALLAWPAILHTRTEFNPAPLFLGLALLPVLFAIGVWSGAVRQEIALPEWWLLFAFSNLFLTCLTEEAFFRGYLQSALSARFGSLVGLMLASLLFGLAHAPGGLELVVFASILGLACGLGYAATGRLWVPTLMHFGFNFAHLSLFTYPGPV
ncbi:MULTISPECIES: CPBP family intramembrane glutamic endopeptidase [unclassified Ruegeria]|uniref:CPBP family intramembrane glutamic endopeptidase n=1 Tax=unclassified Ruegeria TaxID=2625375 RepID=UPI0014881C95|nr:MULTISPECIES: CPBP family intramembrane glutamic endopeptidase [unclassified Ruegeria]